MNRPYPPPGLVEDHRRRFEPSPELETFARLFISDGQQLVNPEHEHLAQADIGFLWTNVENSKKGRRILGTCQLIKESGEKWTSGRSLMQIESWFDGLPDFLITIDACAVVDMTDPAFMALIEHELYHAAQATDEFGSPMFSKQTGFPIWAMRGHDVEEFVGVVRRYGADASGVRELVAAANRGPEIGEGLITRACGTCLRLVK